MIKKFKLENLDCANCGAKIERMVKKLAGVNDACVNFMMQSIVVDFASEDIDSNVEEIKKICKKVEPDCKLKV